MDPLSLYLHIPFCAHRCAYCDFNTYTSVGDLKEAYAAALADEIRQAAEMGILDGVTTNPSLLSKEKGKGSYTDILKEICKVVPGSVSAEVVAVDADGMVKEAKELAKIGDNIVVKIPMTVDGLKAVRKLAGEGIKTNVTLIFSPLQALMAARSRLSYSAESCCGGSPLYRAGCARPAAGAQPPLYLVATAGRV